LHIWYRCIYEPNGILLIDFAKYYTHQWETTRSFAADGDRKEVMLWYANHHHDLAKKKENTLICLFHGIQDAKIVCADY